MRAMIHAVVMAGGSGTRFWPVSRKLRPKQLLPITGGLPMVAETVARVRSAIPPERTWVVTHRDQAAGVRSALPDVPADHVIAEPCARNTCACAALAAEVIARRDPQAVLVTMPADHDIRPADQFVNTLLAGCESVEQHGGLMVFGIQPTYPATGYGYIQRGESAHRSRGLDVRRVRRFREKPDAKTAAEFLSTGEYLWNSGIFVWRASTILEEVGRFEPKIASELAQFGRAVGTAGEAEALAKAYAAIPSVSVDVAILERAADVRVIAIDYSWSDVGSWDALDGILATDAAGHRTVLPSGSEFVSIDAKNCLVQSSAAHAVAVVGVDGLIVVHTPDATLVCRRGSAENVKKVVEELTRRKREELL